MRARGWLALAAAIGAALHVPAAAGGPAIKREQRIAEFHAYQVYRPLVFSPAKVEGDFTVTKDSGAIVGQITVTSLYEATEALEFTNGELLAPAGLQFGDVLSKRNERVVCTSRGNRVHPEKLNTCVVDPNGDGVFTELSWGGYGRPGFGRAEVMQHRYLIKPVHLRTVPLDTYQDAVPVYLYFDGLDSLGKPKFTICSDKKEYAPTCLVLESSNFNKNVAAVTKLVNDSFEITRFDKKMVSLRQIQSLPSIDLGAS